MSDASQRNRALLDAVNARGEWFEARKTQGVWARRVDEAMTVESKEGPLEARAGDFLCRGAEGELWPQGEASLLEKYAPTAQVDSDGFRYFDVRDTPETHVMAAPIREDAVEVETDWGTMRGQAGDFLAKGLEERDAAYPQDVWVVSKSVFEKTYARV